MRKVYSLSISDEKIIDHLEKIPYKSRYIKDLILQDMTGKPFTDGQIDYINKLIDNRLKGHTVAVSEDDSKREETALALDDLMNDF